MVQRSFNLTLETNADEVADLLGDVAPKVLAQAEVSALNKSMAQERTEIRRGLRDTTGIPAKVLNRRLRIRRAKLQQRVVRLFIGLYNVLAFKDLGAKQLKKGVSYRGPGGRVRNRKGFITTMPGSGHIGAFARQGESRLPIKELSVNFASQARMQVALARVRLPVKFKRLFNHEFNFRVGREIDKRRLRGRP